MPWKKRTLNSVHLAEEGLAKDPWCFTALTAVLLLQGAIDAGSKVYPISVPTAGLKDREVI